MDTTRLYIAEENHLEKLEDILNNHSISVLHLNYSTETKDSLGFGERRINISETKEAIQESNFDGILVLEVIPEYQEKAETILKSRL